MRAKFDGKPEYVVNFMFMVAEEVRYFLAKLGLKTLSEAVGRVDLLYASPSPVNKKATLLEFTQLLQNISRLYPNHSIKGGSIKQVFFKNSNIKSIKLSAYLQVHNINELEASILAV